MLATGLADLLLSRSSPALLHLFATPRSRRQAKAATRAEGTLLFNPRCPLLILLCLPKTKSDLGTKDWNSSATKGTDWNPFKSATFDFFAEGPLIERRGSEEQGYEGSSTWPPPSLLEVLPLETTKPLRSRSSMTAARRAPTKARDAGDILLRGLGRAERCTTRLSKSSPVGPGECLKLLNACQGTSDTLKEA